MSGGIWRGFFFFTRNSSLCSDLFLPSKASLTPPQKVNNGTKAINKIKFSLIFFIFFFIEYKFR